MSNKFQIKRTTVAGRTPNTTNSANTTYIDVGELALNVTDGKLFSSDGTDLIEFGTGTPVYDASGNLITTTYVQITTLSNAASSVIPATDNTYNIGSTSYRFANGYYGGSVFVGNTSVNTQIIGSTTVINGGGNTSFSAITVNANNAYGGAGYAGMLTLRNTTAGATANTKYVRMNSTGQLEIINSGYTATLLSLTDTGNLGTAGTIIPGAWAPGQVIKDTMLSSAEVTVVSTTIAATGSNVDFITYDYTPVSSSSYLIVHIHISKYVPAGTVDDSWWSVLKVAGNEIAYGWQKVNDDGNGTSGRSGVLFPLTGRYTNSDTAAKTIAVAARRDTADDSITIDNSATAIWLRITEVAR